MIVKCLNLFAGVLLLAATALASSAPETNESAPKVLRVFGPGGPHLVLEESAEVFRERYGVDVIVTKALPHDLDERVADNGDIYYGGAPCMLEEFDNRNPGVLDMTTVEQLYPRRVGIVVRKDNPLDIQGLACLSREGVGILDVKLENMRHLHGALSGQSRNLRSSVYTGRQGLRAWRTVPEIDAWVTYKSWHVKLADEADFIEIPGEEGQRFTPLALTSRTVHRQEAMNFIEFLKSEEGYEIFQKHGWD